MIHTWAYLSENEIIIIKRALLKKHLDKSGNEFFDPISASNGVRQPAESSSMHEDIILGAIFEGN